MRMSQNSTYSLISWFLSHFLFVSKSCLEKTFLPWHNICYHQTYFQGHSESSREYKNMYDIMSKLGCSTCECVFHQVSTILVKKMSSLCWYKLEGFKPSFKVWRNYAESLERLENSTPLNMLTTATGILSKERDY